MIIYVIIWGCVSSLTAATWKETSSFSRPGDVIISGMFPLHFGVKREDGYNLQSEPSLPVCTDYNFRGFRWMQAMVYAIEEINNSSELLPDVHLGWNIFDTCDTMSRAVTQALTIVNAQNEDSGVNVLVGPVGSTKSIGVANILGVYDIPQISYGSTSRTLSDKTNYNSFLRTIPNDDEQATAMVDLLTFYNWTWVGAIAGDDEYGRPGVSKFKDEARSRGICVEFVEYVSRNLNDNETMAIAERIKSFNATVFVMFISGGDLTKLSSSLKELGVRDKIWVASEAWATSRKVLKEGGAAMHGTLGIATRGGTMGGFRRFLESVSPESQPSPFIKEFWENMFHCSCGRDVCQAGEASRRKRQIEVTTSVPPCTGDEDLLSVWSRTPYLQWTDSELEKSYTTYLAVYTIANALQNITKCKDGTGLLQNGKCPELDTLEPWQLLAYLKSVEFVPPGLDEKFGFDAKGDPNATYKLVSWKPVPNGSSEVEFVHVGNFSKQSTERWSLNTGAIFWHDGNGTQIDEVPTSVCSFPCGVGYYRVKLSSACCHKCMECPRGEFSNSTNAPSCMKCSKREMSNENRTACIPKPEEYMRWNDAYGITFTCLSILGVLLTVFVAIVFYRYRNTAIVKATNVELSFLLFISLSCCFLTPLLFIVRPEDWSCRGRQISFILSFTVCVAAILVKTLRVLTAFQTTMPLNSRKRSRWLGQHLQVLVVVLVALIQVVLCVSWLIVEPPFATMDYEPFDRILVVCDQGSLPLMISVNAYLALLAFAAFVLAFRARKLPENFNEAKFITFSMLVFFIVWLSFIPAYLTTAGVMSTAVYCIGIFASTFGFLGCIFLPKVYIILIKPERNTSERVRMTTVSHAFRSASRSVVYQINTERGSDSYSQSTNITSTENSKVSNNNPKKSPRAARSPCESRVRMNGNAARRTPRFSEPRSGSERKKSREYSIEINGKVKSSLTSPVRMTSQRDKDVLQSSIDVTLQVNIGSENSSGSDDDSFIESPRSIDNMLACNEKSDRLDEKDLQARRTLDFEGSSLLNNHSESEITRQISAKKLVLTKSKSFFEQSEIRTVEALANLNNNSNQRPRSSSL